MDIQTKDGILLRGIPDGTPDYVIKARIEKIRSETTSPTGSGIENFLAGAGKAMADIGRGIRQMVPGAPTTQAAFLTSTPQQLQAVQQEPAKVQADIDEAKRLDAPLMKTGAGLAGNIVGGLVSSLPAALVPGVNTLAGSTIAGGLLGAVQPTATGESGMANTGLGALGGAAGYGAGRLLGKVITPTTSNLTASQTRAMERATAMGAETTPGMRTGSAGLRGLEAGMESFPLTAGPIKAIKETNQGLLNTAAAKAIGENASSITDDVLANAHSRIGQVFKNTEKLPAIPVDDAMQNSLVSVEAKFKGLLDKPLAEMPIVKDIYDNLGKTITGKQYNDWQSQLGKIARSKFMGARSDPNTGFALFEVKSALDDAASAVMTGAEKTAFKTAQQQWKNLVMLETGNVVNEQTGNVSGRLLSGVLSRKDKMGFRLGGNTSELYDMARFSKAFPDIVGDSGTATRSALPLLLGSGGASGLGIGLMTGSPTMGAAAALAPMAAGALARGGEAAYLSKPMQAYLANQFLTQSAQRNVGLLGAGIAAPGLLATQ